MILTTELRLKDKAGCAYLDSLLPEEERVFMDAFREMKSPKFLQNWENTSKFNTHLCQKFGILSRHANSIIYRVRDLLETYRAHKNWEINDKKVRLKALEERLDKKVKTLRKLKVLAETNRLNEKGLRRLRRLKASVYHLRNRINALRQKIRRLEKDLKNGKYRIGIGGKAFFKKQFHLEETSFENHEEWREAFRERKSHMLYYIGRAAETGGNQNCALFINEENGTLRLRLRKEHENRPKGKYVWFDNLVLNYLKKEIYSILENPRCKPLTMRLLKRGRKWYLQIMFEWTEPPIVTDTKEGVISIDVNNGFLQQGELDSKANLKGLKKRLLKYHGGGNRALNEMRQQVREIVDEAGLKRKSIAIEDLDFQIKKARANRRGKRKERRSNKVVSTLDYRRFRDEITRCAAKCGVEVIAVPAYNTSKIAEEKYCPGRCLNKHQGSTITIGRRAMGYKD